MIDGPDDITADWLTDRAARVDARRARARGQVEQIGTGQTGASFRLHLDADGGRSRRPWWRRPPPATAAQRERVAPATAARSASTPCSATGCRSARRGAGMRRSATTTARSSCSSTTCARAARGAGRRVQRRPGGRRGAQPRRAACAAVERQDAVRPRRFSASMTADAAEFLGSITRARPRCSRRATPPSSATTPTTLPAVGRAHRPLGARSTPVSLTLVHGDYRLDNLMFPDAERRRRVRRRLADARDRPAGPRPRLLPRHQPPRRRPARRTRSARWWPRTSTRCAGSASTDYTFDQCFTDYRLGVLQGPMITMIGAAYATAERSASADAMFLAMATASCAALRDLDCSRWSRRRSALSRARSADSGLELLLQRGERTGVRALHHLDHGVVGLDVPRDERAAARRHHGDGRPVHLGLHVAVDDPVGERAAPRRRVRAGAPRRACRTCRGRGRRRRARTSRCRASSSGRRSCR